MRRKEVFPPQRTLQYKAKVKIKKFLNNNNNNKKKGIGNNMDQFTRGYRD